MNNAPLGNVGKKLSPKLFLWSSRNAPAKQESRNLIPIIPFRIRSVILSRYVFCFLTLKSFSSIPSSQSTSNNGKGVEHKFYKYPCFLATNQ